MSKKRGFGVDIGGSGIKGAPVDLKNGSLRKPRYRIPTPQPATPDAVVPVIAEVISHFAPEPGTPVGVTFPGVVRQGTILTAANVDDSWVGVNLQDLLREETGYPAFVLNDADAAGYGEFKFGVAHGRDGVILLTTLGTGIGSALIVDGVIVPNTEFGHLQIDGQDAEYYAAESARERHSLTDAEWIGHLQRYFSEMENLLWPDLIIVGGGVSKEHDRFLPHLSLRAPIVPAELFNEAGIVGAAAFAYRTARAALKESERAERTDA